MRSGAGWDACRFLTCSVLPVRLACQCECPFCFSRSSISALATEAAPWSDGGLRAYFRWARERGAGRMVVTGGGEPLLRAEVCLRAVRLAAETFTEIALFTNGAALDAGVATELRRAGLSYVCWSRHAVGDAANRALMGPAAPDAGAVLAAAGAAGLAVRATCVMNAAGVADADAAWNYVDVFTSLGIRQFTFKHTYVAGERSLFASSEANRWARRHRVAADPFADAGEVVGTLPWGPRIRRIGEVQVCHYYEPAPEWELAQRLARSANLTSDGKVYASLEDQRSLLWQLPPSPTPPASPSSTPPCSVPLSLRVTSRPSGRSSPWATTPPPAPTGPPSMG